MIAHVLGPLRHLTLELLAVAGEEGAGFALFFTNYSTFLGKPGLYLEDVFVQVMSGAPAQERT